MIVLGCNNSLDRMDVPEIASTSLYITPSIIGGKNYDKSTFDKINLANKNTFMLPFAKCNIWDFCLDKIAFIQQK